MVKSHIPNRVETSFMINNDSSNEEDHHLVFTSNENTILVKIKYCIGKYRWYRLPKKKKKKRFFGYISKVECQ